VVRKRNQAAEVDWSEYFRSIRKVCPWSLGSYLKGQIEIVEYQGFRRVLELPLVARVYVCDLNQRRLKKLANNYEISDKENEWFWSHPRYLNHSAPVPCLIQQNRKFLAEQRLKYQKILVSINNQ
jgi:hypothetical protein